MRVLRRDAVLAIMLMGMACTASGVVNWSWGGDRDRMKCLGLLGCNG